MALRDRPTLLDEMADGVLVVGVSTGEIRTVNDTCCEMLGYTETELRGQTIASVTAGDNEPVTGDGRCVERARNVGAVSFEWQVETGEDQRTAVEARLTTTTREGDEIAVITLREAPNRDRTPPIIERQRDRYRTLFDNEEFVLWEQDFSTAKAYAEGLAETGAALGAYLEDHPEELLEILARMDVHMVNEAALDFYGVDSKEQLVANFDEMMVQETREGLTAMWQAIVDDERYFCTECTFQPLDGDEIRHELMEVYVPESHDDDYSLVFTTATDITDRKRREQRLADAKARYRRILDRSSDYVLVCTGSGTIDYVSPGIESTLGYDPDDLVGTDAFDHVHPGDRDEVQGVFEEMLDDPETTATVEYRVEAADGSYRWVEARGGNYFGDPLIDGVMVTIRDIVERKQYEQELVAERDARSTLQQELARDTSVEAFASAVCAELVALDAVAAARIGRVTPGDGVAVLASAGDDTASTDGGIDLNAASMPIGDGIRTGEPSVTVGEGEGDAAEMTVPITYDGVTRGIVVIRLTEQTADVEPVRLLLEESADVLGYAMASDERRQALAADEWVQLTVTVETADTPLSRAVAVAETTAEVATTVTRGDGAVLCYLDIADDPTAFVEAARECDGIERATRVGDRSTVQVLVASPVPSAVVAEHGGGVDDATVTAERTTLTVRVPTETGFDLILDALTDRFDDVVERDFTTTPTDVGASEDPLKALTERQRQVLSVAHHSGYFEKPRAQNASDVAASLGVSRPAYDEVLRAAQRNLLGDLLGEAE